MKTATTEPYRKRDTWYLPRLAGKATRRSAPTMFQITDRLHEGHAAIVTGDNIAATVALWLAQLDAQSPFVDDLAQAACAGDWPAVHAISDHLSVDVTVVGGTF